MSRVIPAGLLSRLQEPATQLTQLWEITRVDGTVFRLTSSDQPVSFLLEEWSPGLGIDGKNIEDLSSLAVSNSEFSAILESGVILDDDLRLGKFDNATVRIYVFDLELEEGFQVFSGHLGQIEIRRGRWVASLRGIADRLRTRIIDQYSPTCRASLGDSKCGVVLEPPDVQRLTAYEVGDIVRSQVFLFPDTRKYGDLVFRCTIAGTTTVFAPAYPATPGQTVTDGTAEFFSEASFVRTSTVTSVVDERTFRSTKVLNLTDGYFSLGVLTFESGPNTGIPLFVKLFNAELTFKEWTMYQPLPFTPGIGDVFRVQAGCDKRVQTCIQKFDNVLRFRGEPFLAGTDWLIRYPST